MHFRVLHRGAWPVVVPMYRLRQCPDCGALVLGKQGQRLHEMSGLHGDGIIEDATASRALASEDGWVPVFEAEDGG